MLPAQTLPRRQSAAQDENLFSTVTPALLKEILNALARDTWWPSRPREPCDGNFGRAKVAEIIFLTCECLELQASVKYLAVELFDKYMMRQTKAQHDELLKQQAAGTSEEMNWKALLPNAKSELLLQMMSCVQLASKQTDYSKVVTPKSVQMMVQMLSGSRVDFEEILASELALLQVLRSNIHRTSPLSHVEILLEVLGHDSTLPVKALRSNSFRVLDLVYLLRTTVYNDLFTATSTGDVSDPSNATYREHFWMVEADFVLLAAAVITAAAYFSCYPMCKKVMEQTSRATTIPEQDVNNFAKVLVQHVWAMRKYNTRIRKPVMGDADLH